MLVPALEVTCHLLLPRLLGTNVPAVPCMGEQIPDLSEGRDQEKQD